MPRPPEWPVRVDGRDDAGEPAPPNEPRDTSRTGVRTSAECRESGRSVAWETILGRVRSDSLIALAIGIGGMSSFLEYVSSFDSARLSDRLRLPCDLVRFLRRFCISPCESWSLRAAAVRIPPAMPAAAASRVLDFDLMRFFSSAISSYSSLCLLCLECLPDDRRFDCSRLDLRDL